MADPFRPFHVPVSSQPQIAPPFYPSTQNFTTQMMQLQLKIMQERQKNVALKKIVAQNIIAERTRGSYQTQHQLHQPFSFASQPQPNKMHRGNLFERNRNGLHDNNDIIMSQKNNIDPNQLINVPPGNKAPAMSPSDINPTQSNDDYLENELAKFHGSNQSDPVNEEKPKVKFAAAQAQNQKLHSLEERISSIVQETSKLFSSDVDDQLPVSKRKLKQQRAAHIKHKEDVQSLLRNKNTTNFEILPKWKHILLRNNPNPPPYTVMKSVRLWRVISWALVVMVTTPIVDVYKKKKKFLERDKREFKRTLDLFMETFDDYVGKATLVPIHSIVSDPHLDFDIKDIATQKQKLLQLKVRLKGLVTAISSAALPSPSITTFLVSMISDGTYLPEDFLWNFEYKMLDFDRLGAQRAVLVEVDPALAAKVGYKMVIQPPSSSSNEGPEQRPIIVDITRARTILINFLLVRVLIYRVGLTPWQHGVSAQPVNRNIRRTVLNLRVLMTLFYMLLRLINDRLPSLGGGASNADTKHKAHLQQSTKTGGLAAGRLLSVKHLNVAVQDEEEDIKIGDDSTADSKAPLNPQESSGPQGILKSVLKLAGFADTTPGFEVFKKDSIEFLFLQPKTANYCSLEHLRSLLMPVAYMSKLEAVTNDWFDELVPALSDWAQRLTEHVVLSAYAAKLKQGTEEGSERTTS
eukprot:gene31821-38477_t